MTASFTMAKECSRNAALDWQHIATVQPDKNVKHAVYTGAPPVTTRSCTLLRTAIIMAIAC